MINNCFSQLQIIYFKKKVEFCEPLTHHGNLVIKLLVGFQEQGRTNTVLSTQFAPSSDFIDYEGVVL